MESLREFFRTGMGPSSSHTMGPRRAAEIFLKRFPDSARFTVTLYGSLAATGKGHFTDRAIMTALGEERTAIDWQPQTVLPFHPNGMRFIALDDNGGTLGEWVVFSVGGGALREEGQPCESKQLYPQSNCHEMLAWTEAHGQPFWMLVEENEGVGIWDFLDECWRTMQAAITRGLQNEAVLPGGLNLRRKARSVCAKARDLKKANARTGIIAAYALAVSEENAGGDIVVTAPTCGSCGIVPAVLYYLRRELKHNATSILRALATAGLIGNIVKQNGSISGAEVGCQGEVGVACAMAAAAATQVLGGTPAQIEYAAEMGLEHFLGLTCDPVLGLVQIPCIERNALAANKALICAEYALLSDGRHRVSFDQVVRTMMQTGHDLPALYRETSTGGLASVLA